jgi:hypothetical protein
MHTKDKLAAELENAGLYAMALKARGGYYHDFLSPLPTPCLQLVTDLAKIGTPMALTIRQRAMNGDFDASVEESEDWAAGPDGQQALSQLVKDGGR